MSKQFPPGPTRSVDDQVTSSVARKGISNFRFAILGSNALVLVLNYGDRAALGVAAPLIIHEFGFSKGVMGLILSAFALSYAPACFVGGWLADKFGPRKVMTWAAILWSAFTAATALCFNLPTFILQRLLFGAGEGPQGAVTARTMGNWFPQREYASAIGLTFAANPLGAALGTPLVAWLLFISDNNWRFPFLILGGIGLLVAVFWYAIVRDRPDQHPWVTQEELLYIQQGRASSSAGTKNEAVLPLRYYIAQPAVWGNALAFFGFSWILFMFLSWYPVFLVEQYHVDLKGLAWAGALPWVAGSVGTAMGGLLSDALVRRSNAPFATRKWMAVICLAGGASFCIPLALAQSATSAVVMLTFALLLLYLSNAQFFALVEASVPSARLGAVTGFVHFCANCAAIIAPVVTGFVVQELKSWLLAFGLAAALALAGALVLMFARKPVELT